jgi:hypothetical protein
MRFIGPARSRQIVVLVTICGLLIGLMIGGFVTITIISAVYKLLSDPTQACPDNTCFGVDLVGAYLVFSGAGIGGLVGSIAGLACGLVVAERCRRFIQRIDRAPTRLS